MGGARKRVWRWGRRRSNEMTPNRFDRESHPQTSSSEHSMRLPVTSATSKRAEREGVVVQFKIWRPAFAWQEQNASFPLASSVPNHFSEPYTIFWLPTFRCDGSISIPTSQLSFGTTDDLPPSPPTSISPLPVRSRNVRRQPSSPVHFPSALQQPTLPLVNTFSTHFLPRPSLPVALSPLKQHVGRSSPPLPAPPSHPLPPPTRPSSTSTLQRPSQHPLSPPCWPRSSTRKAHARTRDDFVSSVVHLPCFASLPFPPFFD